MPYSHNRSLIAQLGFADPDKENPEHFIACQYLSKAAVAEKLVKSLRISSEDPRNGLEDVELEHRIFKGKKNMTTVGFADVLITYKNYPRAAHDCG